MLFVISRGRFRLQGISRQHPCAAPHGSSLKEPILYQTLARVPNEVPSMREKIFHPLVTSRPHPGRHALRGAESDLRNQFFQVDHIFPDFLLALVAPQDRFNGNRPCIAKLLQARNQ